MTTLESRTFVTISTSHVSAETAGMLDSTPCAQWPGVGDQRIPDDLFAVMTWARQKGFGHVLLDRDAEQVNNLAWHDW